MKILIIGGTSSIANALKTFFFESVEIITAGRKECDITLNFNDPFEEINFPDDLDVVIHTAAHFGGKAAKDILDAECINVLGTLKLCQAAVRAKAKHFILISSIFASLRESSEHYNIYSLSKKHAEEVARFYSSGYSLPLTILRPSQIYGNEDRFRVHQPFLYTMIDKAEKGEDITLYGSNDAVRNFIHIDDLTNIIVKVIECKVEGTYACMYTADLTYSQIADAAFSAFNRKGVVRFLKDKPNIPDNIFEKDDSLYKKIGFYPQISIEEGMRKIAVYRNAAI